MIENWDVKTGDVVLGAAGAEECLNRVMDGISEGSPAFLHRVCFTIDTRRYVEDV